jgi:hypothetical protein
MGFVSISTIIHITIISLQRPQLILNMAVINMSPSNCHHNSYNQAASKVRLFETSSRDGEAAGGK